MFFAFAMADDVATERHRAKVKTDDLAKQRKKDFDEWRRHLDEINRELDDMIRRQMQYERQQQQYRPVRPTPRSHTKSEFETLLSASKSLSEANIVYRRLAMKHHPDHGGDAEKMKELNIVFAIIKGNFR